MEAKTFRVALMGPPQIHSGIMLTKAQARRAGDPEVLEFMAILFLSVLANPTAKAYLFEDGQSYPVKRQPLVAALYPQMLEQNSRDAYGHAREVLEKLNAVLSLKRPLRQNSGEDSRERSYFDLNLAHVSLDVYELQTAAKHLKKEENQNFVILHGANRLLDGMSYSWLDQPPFSEMRRRLDDNFLNALHYKITNLLAKIEDPGDLGQTERADEHRSAALFFIQKGRERLRTMGGEHPLAARFDELLASVAPLPARSSPGKAGADAPPVRRHNIPRRITSFIGRDEEVAKLETLLGTERIVTIHGMGGCGKTRLALQVALDYAERLGGNAWLVELAGLTDSPAVPQAVARVLELSEQKQKTVTDALVDKFRTTPGLLVLDNCEHLLDGCAPLAKTLTEFCPELTVLATSREFLDTEGEYAFRLDTLTVPPTDPATYETPDPIATLLEYPAARLFTDRVRPRNDFSILPEHVLPIASICARLEGIPLALEMAAGHAFEFTLSQIDERLTDRFGFLTNGRRTAEDRQKTLRAVIDWSYDLLTEQEREILRRLSVFAGGWTLKGAQRIGATSKIDASEVKGLLTRLVKKSLVTLDPNGAAERYGMLETIHQYAGERLNEYPDAEDLRQCHARFHLAWIQEISPALTGNDPLPTLAGIDQEYDNLRAALTWFFADGGNPEMGLRLCTALNVFWQRRGSLAEARQWLAQGIARGADVPPEALAQALREAAEFASHQADYPEATRLYEQCLRIQRTRSHIAGIAAALEGLGRTATNLGDLVKARPLFEQVLTLGRDHQDREITLHGLMCLGDLEQSQWWRDRRDSSSARAHYREALNIAQEVKADHALIHLLDSITEIDVEEREYDVCRALCEEVLRVQRACGNSQGIASALRNLGTVAAASNDGLVAHAYYEESRGFYHGLGDKTNIGRTFRDQGQLAANEGNHERALVLYRQWLVIEEEAGTRAQVAMALQLMGNAAARKRDYPLAKSYYDKCLMIRREISNSRDIAFTLFVMGHAAERLGYAEDARAAALESLNISREVGDQSVAALALSCLGNVAMDCGDLQVARASYEEGLAIRRTFLDNVDVAYMLSAIGNLTLQEGDPKAARNLHRCSLAFWRESCEKTIGTLTIRGTAFTLAGCIRLATETRRIREASCLLGVINGLGEHIPNVWPFHMLESYLRDLAIARAALDDDSFTEAWNAGRAMTLNEAIEYALTCE